MVQHDPNTAELTRIVKRDKAYFEQTTLARHYYGALTMMSVLSSPKIQPEVKKAIVQKAINILREDGLLIVGWYTLLEADEKAMTMKYLQEYIRNGTLVEVKPKNEEDRRFGSHAWSIYRVHHKNDPPKTPSARPPKPGAFRSLLIAIPLVGLMAGIVLAAGEDSHPFTGIRGADLVNMIRWAAIILLGGLGIILLLRVVSFQKLFRNSAGYTADTDNTPPPLTDEDLNLERLEEIAIELDKKSLQIDKRKELENTLIAIVDKQVMDLPTNPRLFSQLTWERFRELERQTEFAREAVKRSRPKWNPGRTTSSRLEQCSACLKLLDRFLNCTSYQEWKPAHEAFGSNPKIKNSNKSLKFFRWAGMLDAAMRVKFSQTSKRGPKHWGQINFLLVQILFGLLFSFVFPLAAAHLGWNSTPSVTLAMAAVIQQPNQQIEHSPKDLQSQVAEKLKQAHVDLKDPRYPVVALALQGPPPTSSWGAAENIMSGARILRSHEYQVIVLNNGSYKSEDLAKAVGSSGRTCIVEGEEIPVALRSAEFLICREKRGFPAATNFSPQKILELEAPLEKMTDRVLETMALKLDAMTSLTHPWNIEGRWKTTLDKIWRLVFPRNFVRRIKGDDVFLQAVGSGKSQHLIGVPAAYMRRWLMRYVTGGQPLDRAWYFEETLRNRLRMAEAHFFIHELESGTRIRLEDKLTEEASIPDGKHPGWDHPLIVGRGDYFEIWPSVEAYERSKNNDSSVSKALTSFLIVLGLVELAAGIVSSGSAVNFLLGAAIPLPGVSGQRSSTIWERPYMKLRKIISLMLLVLLPAFGKSQALPALEEGLPHLGNETSLQIKDVSGTLKQGEILTISGTGLGTFDPKMVDVFDDFNRPDPIKKLADGRAVDSGWIIFDESNKPISIVKDPTHSNDPNDMVAKRSSVGTGSLKRLIDSNQREIYVSFDIKLSPAFDIKTKKSGSHQFKIIRFYTDSDMSIYPMIRAEYPVLIWGMDNLHPTEDPDSELKAYQGKMKGTLTPGRWHNMRIYVKKSSGDRTFDGALRLWIDGALIFDWDHDIHNPSYAPHKITRGFDTNGRKITDVHFLHYFSSASPETWAQGDDFYLGYSMDRVEVGDAPTYAECARRKIQVPTQWDNHSIQLKANLTGFPPGKPLYLFVIKKGEDGKEVISIGFPLSEKPQMPAEKKKGLKTGLKLEDLYPKAPLGAIPTTPNLPSMTSELLRKLARKNPEKARDIEQGLSVSAMARALETAL